MDPWSNEQQRTMYLRIRGGWGTPPKYISCWGWSYDVGKIWRAHEPYSIEWVFPGDKPPA